MAWTAAHRWAAYAVAGLATVGAMRWVDGLDAAAPVAQAVARPRAAPLAASGPALDIASTAAPRASDASPPRLAGTALRDAAGPGADIEVRADPFHAPAAPPPPPASLAPPPPPAPPQAPPLPFAYLGRWTEDGGTTVFLMRGEHTVAVRGPGPLDASYRVEAIDEQQMVLTYLPLNQRQSLPLRRQGGEAVPAAAPAAGENENSEESN